jgi:hypothetical protein
MFSVRILVRTHTDTRAWRRRMRTESIKALFQAPDKILRLTDGSLLKVRVNEELYVSDSFFKYLLRIS